MLLRFVYSMVMSKLVLICKKCGWKHLDWEPCRDDDGTLKSAKPCSGQVVSAPKSVQDAVSGSIRHDVKVDRKVYLRDYGRAKRRGCKWGLSEILKLTDVAAIHALARSVLDNDV